VKILLVEDDAVLGAAMLTFLKTKAYAVELVPDLRTAQALLSVTHWNAVLLDLHLPDGDGLSLLPYIRKHAPEAPVIVLTARDQISDRIRGLDAGADDYLVKPFDPNELLARLRAIERRRSGQANARILVGQLVIDLGSTTVHRAGVMVDLTAKEWSVLRVMASRLERVHSKSALGNALYGFGDEVDSNTLEVFISHLRRKLGRESIQTIRGQGYRLVGQ
jgi:two-component system, OmpR family, response regulator